MTTLKQVQHLPITISQAWEFFATPMNLNRITPPDMSFSITSELPDKMYEGLLITYVVRPFLQIPFYWCTEITHIKEMEFFVDEQRQGPYRFWHHEHHFKETSGGVIMTDLLYYDIGWSFFGWMAGKLWVDAKIRQIFDYRQKVLKEIL